MFSGNHRSASLTARQRQAWEPRCRPSGSFWSLSSSSLVFSFRVLLPGEFIDAFWPESCGRPALIEPRFYSVSNNLSVMCLRHHNRTYFPELTPARIISLAIVYSFDQWFLGVLCIVKMVSKFNMTLSVKREGGQRTVGIFQASQYSPCIWNAVNLALTRLQLLPNVTR